MVIAKLFCIKAEDDNNKDDISYIAEHIIYNIKNKKITLEDLQEL